MCVELRADLTERASWGKACSPAEKGLLGCGVFHPTSLIGSLLQAGMVSPENPEQLIIALEPEAASIYCRKLRLHQMIDLSSRAPVNGYSPSDTIGTGFTQGTSVNSLLQNLTP